MCRLSCPPLIATFNNSFRIHAGGARRPSKTPGNIDDGDGGMIAYGSHSTRDSCRWKRPSVADGGTTKNMGTPRPCSSSLYFLIIADATSCITRISTAWALARFPFIAIVQLLCIYTRSSLFSAPAIVDGFTDAYNNKRRSPFLLPV
jgi:hypothetical protein